jgi:D-alanyl-D-alanine carboxypeptidase
MRPALVFALSLILIGCGTAPTVERERTALPAKASARALGPQLQAVLDAIRERGQLPGVTAAILLKDGSLVSLASGEADNVTKTPMPAGGVMPTGSIGKQFVSAVALSLEHDRRVNLDVTIDRWFRNDAWFEHVPNAHALTLRMLLMHRGGLGDHRGTQGFRDEIMARFAQQPYDPDFRIPPEKLISFVLDTPPRFAPGAGFSYSETGYILAGLALERACTCNYYEELERRFLKPLKLTQTHPANVRRVPGLVQGHIGQAIPGFPPQTTRDGEMLFSPATEWTGGGLYSNSEDLARWEASLGSGRAMSWPYLDELIRGDPALPAPASDNYGLGTRVMTTPLGVAYGHAGEFPGYVSFVAYFPQAHAAVALQTNVAKASPELLKDGAIELLQHALAKSDRNPK